MPEIKIIVLNWNGKHFLQDCLTSLRRQTFRDFQTILVDNGSKDGSVEYVNAEFPEVQILALKENVGFTGGNIAGWKLVREGPPSGMIVLLNNDTEAHPQWLAELYKASQQYPDAGIFASKMMMFDERTRIENCGFGMSEIGFAIDLGRGEPDSPEWSYPRRVFGACAGAAAYRRGMLEKIGFLDDDFFMTAEDIDLSFRAQLHGYHCWMIPSAIVYHCYRGAMRKYPARQAFFAHRNSALVYLKNMPTGLMLRFLPSRMLYELAAAVYAMKTGLGWPFLKAKFDALLKVPKMLRKRKEIQSSRKISNSELHSLMEKRWFKDKLQKMRSAWNRPSEMAMKSIL